MKSWTDCFSKDTPGGCWPAGHIDREASCWPGASPTRAPETEAPSNKRLKLAAHEGREVTLSSLVRRSLGASR